MLYSLHATEAAKGLALALFHCIQEQNVTDFFNINGESLKLSKEVGKSDVYVIDSP